MPPLLLGKLLDNEGGAGLPLVARSSRLIGELVLTATGNVELVDLLAELGIFGLNPGFVFWPGRLGCGRASTEI